MFKRQRAAKWFLCLACLVILVCMTQRIASLHALEKSLLLTSSSSQVVAEENEAPTPCELSAKSLLASPPVLFELAIFSLGLLLLLLVPIIPTSMRFPPPRVISPSGLRVHLRLCIFRE
ncbi:copper resistance protein [Yersinia enterocolitica]|uniref:Metal resistance protein n=1 Tax=Yersinia enterocolitica serotype O:8 / biotype 1B (strain NCTC 13174 / 8081) TaxID=393305 RepID=A1JKV2_YERE8|nr:copper resistance protein [Yersinia enterocolitica]PNM08885.1 copper resistance protein [Yersinia enterocolitica]CAL11391.1 putative metal resistance protein [Yersinia enterocolitica subsp. enterocolitica 8081]HDL8281582.1 copper resistance protein [Yersinia enterocolitica]HDL8433205.1 copper resistance protein [Yersinia enterocolitica]HDL8485950.1 copper resistance protein [Yersinia enterocolitica]